MRRTTKATRRTTVPDKPRANRRTTKVLEQGHIPFYQIGDVISRKKHGSPRYLLVEQLSPLITPKPKFFTIHLDSNTLLANAVEVSVFYVYDYKVIRQIKDDKVIAKILTSTQEENTNQLFSAMKLLRISPTKEPKSRPDLCNDGNWMKITAKTETQGSHPLRRGHKVHLKGNRVLEVKAYCSDCGALCSILYSKRMKAYVLAKHKVKKKKEKKEKKSRRTTPVVIKRRRTT